MPVPAGGRLPRSHPLRLVGQSLQRVCRRAMQMRLVPLPADRTRKDNFLVIGKTFTKIIFLITCISVYYKLQGKTFYFERQLLMITFATKYHKYSMMKNFKFLVILMCLSLCFGGTVYAAQVQRTNDDIIINMKPSDPDFEPERSENVLTVIGQVYQNPLHLVLSLPEKLGETTITVKDTQTDAILGTTTVNAMQESTVTLDFEQGSGRFVLTIASAEYEGEGEFTL